jgi:hypothetical protein
MKYEESVSIAGLKAAKGRRRRAGESCFHQAVAKLNRRNMAEGVMAGE